MAGVNKDRLLSFVILMKRQTWLLILTALILFALVVVVVAYAIAPEQPRITRLIKKIDVESGFVDTGVWSPDGKLVATSGTFFPIRIWDIESGRQVAMISFSTTKSGVAWSPDSRLLAIAANQPKDTLQVWDVKEKRSVFSDNPKSWVSDVAWSPDGKILAAGISGVSNGDRVEDAAVLLYDTASWKQISVFTYTNFLGPIAWAPDSRRLIIVSTTVDLEESEIVVWDIATNQRRTIGLVEGINLYSLEWAPNGKELAIGLNDTQVAIMNVDTGEVVQTVDHGSQVTSFSLSRDWKQIATASQGSNRGYDNNKVKIWDVSSGRLLYELVHGVPLLLSVDWSPDGSFLATTTQLEDSLWIWDAK